MSSMTPVTWALIPVKRLAQAKSRLAGALRPDARQRLVEDMLAQALSAASGARGIARVAVITDCDRIADCAHAHGALVERDPPPANNAAAPSGSQVSDEARTLGYVVDHGLARISAMGAHQALVLMGDLPTIDAADVDAAIAPIAPGHAVLAPDRARQGTNALGLCMHDRLPTCFGHPDSLQRHLQRFANAGLTTSLIERRALAFDLDTVEDLQTHRTALRPATPRSALR